MVGAVGGPDHGPYRDPVRNVCVFLGSASGRRPEYAAAAAELGTELAARRLRLVYGGGRVGLMGAVADAALAAGGEVVGVIPQGLVDREVAHNGLTDLRVVGGMHERKALMTELSDGVVALPGGLGTLDELFESLTWAQLGLHGLERKPVGLLDTASYWTPLLALIEHTVDEGFVGRDRLDTLLRSENPAALLDLMLARTAVA